MKDKATRLLEIRSEFNSLLAFGRGWRAVVLFRDWAKACGHHQVVDAVDSFMRFVEGDDA